MTNLEQSFINYDNMLAKAIAQFNKDLQAFSDALDTVIMNRAADDGAIIPDTQEITENMSDRTDSAYDLSDKPCSIMKDCNCCCIECGDKVEDIGHPRRCGNC